ncbi:MAG: aldo/keto reductase [Chloroflexi bacterium]|nr:aldo/keto reductase [Chloroflexota bacterium]MCY4248056.1 aldo/keto reductase [Chloroflexota bacterium]
MPYQAAQSRYDSIEYRRSGKSGLLLPAISLGIWWNFGGNDLLENSRAMLRTAFDLGVTHIDIANNYGPPPGSAEDTFGTIYRQDLAPYRDELIISNKAGYRMWPGPYGEWGSRKYLVASCDQSLKRTGLDYFDIFYSHRPDPDTPLEETMSALDYIVRSGRALYAGLSSYQPAMTQQAVELLRELGTPCLIHQPRYNMFDRWVEDGLLDALEQAGVGCICFSPLDQGILTNKYIDAVPDDSRAVKNQWGDKLPAVKLAKVRALNEVAMERGQTMAQLALAWTLRHPQMTSALIGASKSAQIVDAVGALKNLAFSDAELARIEAVLAG